MLVWLYCGRLLGLKMSLSVATLRLRTRLGDGVVLEGAWVMFDDDGDGDDEDAILWKMMWKW